MKDGYEGYNSTPSSPTKYTVNRIHQKDSGGKYIVSRLCILITALLLVLALLIVFLCTYFLAPGRCATCDHSAAPRSFYTENGESVAAKTDSPFAHSTSFDLTNDQIEIDVMSDGYNEFSKVLEEKFVTSTEENHVDNVTLYRLPTDIIPTHYRIKIIPLIEDENPLIDGQVYITMKCVKSTDRVIFNVRDIDINNINIYAKTSNVPLTIEETAKDVRYERFTIVLSENLVEGQEYVLHIVYKGKIRDVSNGLYRSFYIDSETKSSKWIANTLFSPTFARYVYPSFDEPSFKAVFQISIGRTIDKISLSNMDISAVRDMDDMEGWVWDDYKETPPMSTYLTAFLIAPKTALKQNTTNAIPSTRISLWTRPYGGHKINFSLRFAVDILKFYENYFGVKFPLSKIDIVGVPSHNYNAMENWGLIIFREETLLINKGNSIKIQQSLALMLAHELAHQWIGNLVTPIWFNDLWLKEGFSSYLQCLTIDKIKPEWFVFEMFTLNEMNLALQNDALLSSPPISRQVLQPSKQIFDVITYHKGSSIIRMMANFLEPSNLKLGLKSYLKKYEYSNANREDLWESLTLSGYKYATNKTTQLNVIMDSWISQPGYPIINVVRDYKMKTATISQERFTLNENKTSTQLWWIPLSFTTKQEKDFNNTIPKFWLSAENYTEIFNMPDKNNWILFNLMNTGFYRVNYDKSNWILLINDFTDLPLLTKAQLISDSMNLARGGYLDYTIALSITLKVAHEIEYLPWHAATQTLMYIRSSLIKMPAYGNFKKFVSYLIGKAYEHVKSDEIIPWIVPNDPIPEMFSENIIRLACMVDYWECVQNAKYLFDLWRKSPDEGNIIPEPIRPLVYCTSIQKGTSEDWDFVFNQFHNAVIKGTRFDPEQASLIKALGCSSEQWLLTKALSLIIKPNSGLTKEEGVELFRSVASNDVGHWLAVSFIRAEWRRLIELYNTTITYEMINSIVVYINSPYDVKLLKLLVNEITEYTKEESLILKQAVEIAQNNIVWMEKHYRIVDEWLYTFVRKVYP